MPSLTHCLIAAGLLSLGTGAIAQPSGPDPHMGAPGKPRFMTAGPRPTGMRLPVTRAELQAQLTQRFDRLDANHDGKISSEDRDARAAQRRDRMFDAVDDNKDGSISRQEFAGARTERGMGRMRGMMPGAGGPPPGGPPPGPPQGRPPREGAPAPAMGPMRMMAQNGPIAKSDFLARGMARFDEVDTNHDGTISPAERDTARDTMRDSRRRPMMPPPQPQTPRPGQ